ncbi:hypothetical protein A8990_10624 [Paenibacillus taihuensis]|uniref:Uncharacterized protein n=1 Tax=Paenibacillus taihuensis TaxID=1156355 RepID=A0A3D9SH02_9BACL|nr:hypothetical protein [Paenibacillus taihuensis]REE90521.1 hypothetical protein A8990_10624 [Paenibacillus taihuensis]
MKTIELPLIVDRYKVYSGDIHRNLKYFIEVSESISGGLTEKKILNCHVDRLLFFSDVGERFKLEITQRSVENGDEFIFLNVTNHTEKNQVLKFSLVLNNISESEVYDLNEGYKEPAFSPRYGQNKLSTPSKYVSTNVGSIFISKCMVFSDNNLNYKDHKKSITRKLHEEKDGVSLTKKQSSIHLEFVVTIASGKKADQFFLISEKALFNSSESLKAYFSDYMTSIENNDVRFNMWVTPQGLFTKLPYSIEPFDQDAYGISLHHMSKKEMLRYYQKTGDRFFYNFMYNAIIQLFGYRPSIDRIFLTDYTSTWLKKDYAITSPYIDTRLNETISLTIEDNKSLFSFEELQNYHLAYADFLVDYSQYGKLLSVDNEAYFFPDYFSLESDSKPTHSSLNHQLGILNYLLNKFKLTKNVNYERVSLSLLKAVESTKKQWIKENSDLYYKVSYQNEELCFSETDYIYVTLMDLLLVQESIVELYKEKNTAIGELIYQKMKFLSSNSFGLDDENAKLPPNEDIASRKMAIRLAKKLGYIA